jgi:hypothetical protein
MRQSTIALTGALLLAGSACARSPETNASPSGEAALQQCISWRVEVFNRARPGGVGVYYQVGARPDPTFGTDHDRTSSLGWVAEGMTEIFMVPSPTEPQVVAKIRTGGMLRTVRTGVSITVRCAEGRPGS